MGFKPKRVPPKPAIEGWANLGPDNVVRGWAVNHAAPGAPVRVTVLIDDVGVATTDATELREDVPFDHKWCGFELALPTRFFDGQSHRLAAMAGPEDIALSTRTPSFQLDPAHLPGLRLSEVTSSHVTGRFLAPKIVKTRGVWLWTRADTHTAPATEWLPQRGGEHPFRIDLGSLSLKDLLEQGAAISQAGDHTQTRLASLWSHAAFDWLCETGVCVISVSAAIAVPDGCRARVEIPTRVDGQAAVVGAVSEVEFRNNAARFKLPDDAILDGAGFILRSFVGDQVLSVSPRPGEETILLAATVEPPINLIRNAELRRWQNDELPAPSAGRFEIAQGWTVDNTPGGLVTVAPAPLALLDPDAAADRYALIVSSNDVSKRCRIEAAVETVDLTRAKGFMLRFHASAAGVGRLPARTTRVMDRVALYWRDPETGGMRLVRVLARRVVLSARREQRVIEATITDTDAPPSGVSPDYRLSFEFTSPFALILDSASLEVVPSTGESALQVTPSLEDVDIVEQISSTQGIDHWLAPRILSAGDLHPVEAQSRPLRWSWRQSRFGTVEIVVCVHNAVVETLACLRSLLRSTTIPHTISIIDDASDPLCAQQLQLFAADKPNVRVHVNNRNVGYTGSADFGVRSSSADWVVLLNSDVVTTAGWLEGLLECAASDPKIVAVGPVSNAASCQSVPRLHDAHGEWIVNPLPQNWTPERVAQLVAAESQRRFPVVPLLNGFCMLLKRSAYIDAGGLDAMAFPQGYGEESDLCMRLRAAGGKLAVADHVYVYHAKSASFGSARRVELSKAGMSSLKHKHPGVDFASLVRDVVETPTLVALRDRMSALLPDAGPNSDRGA